MSTPKGPADFIAGWESSAASERANYQLFLAEICDLLAVPRPNPSGADESQNTYVFEKAVTFRHGDGSTSAGRIDLYKRGCFVCETKQGSLAKRNDPATGSGTSVPLSTATTKKGHGVRGSKTWDDALIAARGQAEAYVRALPDDNPPFILVIDVGYSIELYADFSRLGKVYTPFPDARSHRLYLHDLATPVDLVRQPLVDDPPNHHAPQSPWCLHHGFAPQHPPHTPNIAPHPLPHYHAPHGPTRGVDRRRRRPIRRQVVQDHPHRTRRQPRTLPRPLPPPRRRHPRPPGAADWSGV